MSAFLLAIMVCVWQQTHATVLKDTQVKHALSQVSNIIIVISGFTIIHPNSFTVLSECDDNPCESGGSCQILAGSIICTCPPGLTGILCESCKLNEWTCTEKIRPC